MKLKGRTWLTRGKWGINLEYNLLWKAIFCGLEIRLNSTDTDRAVTLSFHIPGIVDLWFSVDHPSFSRFMPSKRMPSMVRDSEYWDMPLKKWIGVKWHDGTLWWSLWENRDAWSSSQPWWWGGSFTPKDFLLGRSKHSKHDVKTSELIFGLPEGDYNVKVETWTSTWRRPRWPFAKSMNRVQCDFDPPIPVPGKGENSWDLDDDALYSITTGGKTVDETLYALVDDVIRIRSQYGGSNWIPDNGWPTGVET